MINLSMLPYLPYIFLLCSVLSLMLAKHKFLILSITYGLAVISALILHIISPITLVAILIFIGLLFLYSKLENKLYLQTIMMLVIFAVGFLFFMHKIPGVNNLLVFNKLQISQDGIPFTMYLNFDKITAGLWIVALATPVILTGKDFLKLIPQSIIIIIATVIVVMVLSLAFNFVRFDFKYGNYFWVWLLNNLFFVCLAEEALFRGFVQNHIYKLKFNPVLRSVVAIVLPAVIFGALHYTGGMQYVILATVSGIMYGFLYHKTRSIEMVILSHATVNIIHILFFTYPALASSF